MKRHFARWGWVNFLKMISITKAFDLPGSGLNSIDCVRKAKAFDVLMWASEDKSFNESESLDFDEEIRKNKNK